MSWHVLYRDLTASQASTKLRNLREEKMKLMRMGCKGNYRSIRKVKGREVGTVFGGTSKQLYNIEIEPV
jgi:hypothetical protein